MRFMVPMHATKGEEANHELSYTRPSPPGFLPGAKREHVVGTRDKLHIIFGGEDCLGSAERNPFHCGR